VLLAPNVNGLLETSLPLLLPVGAPNDIPVVNPDDTPGGPKVKMGFLSATAGGVLGGAPNENGLLDAFPSSGTLGGWPNKKPELGCAAGVGAAGFTIPPKADVNFGVSGTTATGFPKSEVEVGSPKSGAGTGISGAALTVGSGSLVGSVLAAPKINSGWLDDEGSVALGGAEKEKADGFDFADNPPNNDVESESLPASDATEEPNIGTGVKLSFTTLEEAKGGASDDGSSTPEIDTLFSAANTLVDCVTNSFVLVTGSACLSPSQNGFSVSLTGPGAELPKVGGAIGTSCLEKTDELAKKFGIEGVVVGTTLGSSSGALAGADGPSGVGGISAIGGTTGIELEDTAVLSLLLKGVVTAPSGCPKDDACMD
jgi:hypothetical protein